MNLKSYLTKNLFHLTAKRVLKKVQDQISSRPSLRGYCELKGELKALLQQKIAESEKRYSFLTC